MPGRETTQPHIALPTIWAEEVTELAARYGQPVYRAHKIQADEYIYSYRWRKDSDRRAEVVFAIQNGGRNVWVHAKPHYPAHIFRLPSGGVHWDEGIEAALLREVEEETGLAVRIERFLGLVEYHFYHGDSTVQFASYVFHLSSSEGAPVIHESEEISEFRAVTPPQLAQLAYDLRNLGGNRRGWGQWRALAHDVVYEYLSN
mgnify:CR=1 FL=1